MTVDWERFLAPGERLIWQGAPRRGVRRWPGLAYSALGVPFVAASVLMAREAARFRLDIAVFFDLATFAAAIVFGCLGAYLTVGVWIAEATRHRRTGYALTDRRGYVATREGVTSVPLVHPIDVTASGDGTGSILFGPRDRTRESATRLGFIGIDDVERVAELMRRVQDGWHE